MREHKIADTFEYSTWYLFSTKYKMRKIVLKKPRKIIKKLFSKYEYKDNIHEAGICFADFNNDSKEDRYIVVTGYANKCITSQHDPKNQDRYTYVNIAVKAGITGKANVSAHRINYDVGATCADIDNDGDQDIIVTSLYGPNEVFKQVKKLKFKESAKTLHLYSDFSRSQSGIWGDVNNDGYIDLFVSNVDSSNHLYLNNGAGIFKDVTDAAGLSMPRGGTGSVFGDIDNDGDLDLFIPRYGAANKLFRNDCSHSNKKDIKFTDITNVSRVAGRDTLARSVHGLFADFDGDGDLDLFVANSGTRNWLYLNDGSGKFHDMSDSTGFSTDRETNVVCSLDADNDGDLDLLVCNRNRNRYYENQGKAHFIDKSPPTFVHKGGYPTGIAAADFDNDGDVDLYCSDDFQPSFELRNQTNNNNYIEIRINCSKSNRDGIGSKLYLFQQGHLGEKASLLAMRHIAAGGPRNSMSSRVVHFGIADGKPKDILIKFPSGIQRKLLNVQPGKYLQINEQDGMARKLSLLQKWYIRNTRYTPNRNEAFYIFSYFFAFLAGFFLTLRRSWNSNIRYFVLWIPLGLFVVFYIILRDSSTLSHYFFPPLLSLGSAIFGLYVSRKIFISPLALAEYQEKLFFATNAFFHGEWGARKLNRLKLYCSNLSADEIPAKEIQSSLLESIDDYFSLVLTEIERILVFAKAANTLPSTIAACRTYLFTLSTSLNALKTELNLNKKLTGTYFDSIIENIRLLQANLRLMRKTVGEQFSCDINRKTKGAIDNLSVPAIEMKLNTIPDAHIMARMRPAEYSQILDNLIENAICAIQNKKKKKIIIKISANSDFVFISVEDNGCGIEPAIKEKLFQEQFSTKNKTGGFGLYNSQIILKKYGGKISLLKTAMNQGSIFELQLKRIDND
ncbi:MAG: GHKL domain-containing protein [Calditrichaeota bacterium]|nr:GHKL domain-containing protein [Calditrichota bacterium]